MRWWLDKGVDGLRLNVINFISKTPDYPEGKHRDENLYTDGTPFFINGPRVHEYIQEMHEKVFKNYNIITVGECPGKINIYFNIIFCSFFSSRCSFTRCRII
jgi:oligo-1,6-glucosidase